MPAGVSAHRSRSSAAAPGKRACGSAAGDGVTFLGWRSDEEIRDLYRTSRAVLLPGIEDFGMVPVEAQACGCPVVALGIGGACETVQHGVTGTLAGDDSVEAFAMALDECRRTPFDQARIRANAEQFSTARFADAFPRGRRRGTAARPGLPSHDAPLQPAARRLLRPFGRVPRHGGVHARVPAAVRDRGRPHSHYKGAASVRAVPKVAALHRSARPDRVPGPGAVPAPARPLADGRLLRRLRRQHSRRRPRGHRHVVLPDLLVPTR